MKSYISTILLGALVGTYLDLLLVGIGYYTFPARPFPSIFSINVLFTLCILPLSVFIIILVFNRINNFQNLILSFILSSFMALSEHILEKWGLFAHSFKWSHIYSIFGYFLFVQMIWHFYKWLNKL